MTVSITSITKYLNKYSIMKILVVISIIGLILYAISSSRKFKFNKEYYSNLTQDQINVFDHKVYGKLMMFKNDLITDVIGTDKIWEELIVKKMSDYYIEGTDVLDVGCHSGLSVLGMNHFKTITGKVHCIEAQSAQCEIIKHNLDNKIDYHLYNTAVSDTPSIVCFDTVRQNTGGTGVDGNHHKTCVGALPIDIMLPYFKNRISVMKIDVEGHEDRVLKGGAKFLATHKPVLEIEIHETNYDKVHEILTTELQYRLHEKVSVHDYIYLPM